ncbi:MULTISPECIES: antitoxin VapB family protein [Halorubrum]|uniref:Uncharacterized protein n=1 Tax=Halorubrum sodomense TaxID=35743 RepID=A0A1I6FK51_HALSD|nr:MULTISPECIES: antitoxin VapB family protein [Halorubrum]TKX54065.1 hypothetical protein EXE42_09955 [Halorubrum sp. SP3]SFR30254.1 hypothetical protein SAMN04487937_0071 [Halorubrum sodomense]
MPTKTIGVREEVYERLRARKRDDESEGDWRDGFGSLSTAETDSLREAARRSRERFDESAGTRQAAAIDRMADAGDDEPPDGGAAADTSDDGTDANDVDSDETNDADGGSA